MPAHTHADPVAGGVTRIPADVELPDRVLGPLTARQLGALAATAAALYGLWQTSREWLPLPAFLTLAAVVLGGIGLLVVGRRDGLTGDQLLRAAIRHHAGGGYRLAAPEGAAPAPGWLTARATVDPQIPHRVRRQPQLPARGVGAAGRDELGVVDLGPDGLAVIAAATTVNFALRTPTEQQMLIGGFGRYLHSLTTPLQILVRAERVDLTAPISDLHARAGRLPDPGLAELARDHAAFLHDLHARAEVLRRQVLLVWREPGPTRRPSGRDTKAAAAARQAAGDRLARRAGEAAALLAPLGITLTPLDAASAGAVLVGAANPGGAATPATTTVGVGGVVTARPANPPPPPDPTAAADPWTSPPPGGVTEAVHAAHNAGWAAGRTW